MLEYSIKTKSYFMKKITPILFLVVSITLCFQSCVKDDTITELDNNLTQEFFKQPSSFSTDNNSSQDHCFFTQQNTDILIDLNGCNCACYVTVGGYTSETKEFFAPNANCIRDEMPGYCYKIKCITPSFVPYPDDINCNGLNKLNSSIPNNRVSVTVYRKVLGPYEPTWD